MSVRLTLSQLRVSKRGNVYVWMFLYVYVLVMFESM